jgi:gluconokinase
MQKPRVIVVMGVSGSGKSTVGALLAERNHGLFHDADDYHPPANIAKMAAGIPLTDEDRRPWLERLRLQVIDPAPPDKLTILACSALKKNYRELLGIHSEDVRLVYLQGSPETLALRLEHRTGHYMKPSMLESQLAALEEPHENEALIVGIEPHVDEITRVIESALGLKP